MVSVNKIAIYLTERFLNRTELNQIEKRLRIAPPGIHFIKDGKLFLHRDKEEPELLATIHRLGCDEFYKHAQEDIEALVEHVKAADKENDQLIEQLKQTTEEVENLQKSLKKSNQLCEHLSGLLNQYEEHQKNSVHTSGNDS